MFNLFDITRKAFINISSDNRIHLFDLDSGREKHCYVERDHLSHQYTSVSWSKAISNGKNDSVVNSKNGSLAIGTSDSKVIIFDLDRGVVKSTFGVDGGVPVDICYCDSSGSSVFVATSGSSFIQRIDCSSGSVISTIKAGKRGILRLCSHPKAGNIVACANTSIRICTDDSNNSNRSGSEDVKKKEAIIMKINTSFPLGLSILEYSSCGKYLACCGMGSKELLVYSTDESADGGDDDAEGIPVAVVALDNVPKSISSFQTSLAKSKSQSASLLFLFVLMENETACIVKANGVENAVHKFDSNVIRLGGKVNILGGSLGSTGNPKSLTSVTLALGNYKKPYFQELAIATEGAYLSSIQIPTQSNAPSTASSSTSHPSTNVHERVQVLGPLDVGLAKRPHISIDNNSSSNLNSATDSNSDSKKFKSGSESSSITGIFELYSQALENRFESFSTQLALSNKIATSRAAATDKDDSPSASISPQNLSDSIEKALQDGDNKLLDECIFFNSNYNKNSIEGSSSRLIIEETCKKLSSKKVVQFVKKVISKFESHPSIGGVLTVWLVSLLKSHGAFLASSSPDLSRQLNSLTIAVDQRMTTLNRFASLAGRIDLLLAQSTQTVE